MTNRKRNLNDSIGNWLVLFPIQAQTGIGPEAQKILDEAAKELGVPRWTPTQGRHAVDNYVSQIRSAWGNRLSRLAEERREIENQMKDKMLLVQKAIDKARETRTLEDEKHSIIIANTQLAAMYTILHGKVRDGNLDNISTGNYAAVNESGQIGYSVTLAWSGKYNMISIIALLAALLLDYLVPIFILLSFLEKKEDVVIGNMPKFPKRTRRTINHDSIAFIIRSQARKVFHWKNRSD